MYHKRYFSADIALGAQGFIDKKQKHKVLNSFEKSDNLTLISKNMLIFVVMSSSLRPKPGEARR